MILTALEEDILKVIATSCPLTLESVKYIYSRTQSFDTTIKVINTSLSTAISITKILEVIDMGKNGIKISETPILGNPKTT